MKARIQEMLQTFQNHGDAQNSRNRVSSGQNLQLEKMLREKDREIDRLRHQLANAESRLQEMMGQDVLTSLPNRHVFK